MGGVCYRALNLVIFIQVLSHLRFQCSPNLSVFEVEEIDFANDCIKNCTAVPKSGTTCITNYLQFASISEVTESGSFTRIYSFSSFPNQLNENTDLILKN